MTRTDTTPFRDPRNAVGLLTDVLDLALAGPVLVTLSTKNREMIEMINVVARARDLGREFTKAPRKVFNGYRRRGTAGLYQRLKIVSEEMPEDLWLLGEKERALHGTLRSISERGLKIAMIAMENATQWQKFSEVLGEWHRAWHDHVSSALRLGADQAAIVDAECGWRFRDLTDRSHRGRNIRAAFEAAWLAGQYKFAQQLIAQEFK
jgi:hypothetical protein